MKRWLLWFVVGLVVYVVGMVAYIPEVDAPRLFRLAMTVALRLWVYTTGAAFAVAVIRWLFVQRPVSPPA
jgi:hypothetical protein